MKLKKKKRKISLHRRLSVYNFMVAIVPVFLSVCITLTFIFSLIHMIYSDDNHNGKAHVNNSRDIVTVYFCQFNIRVIENAFKDGNTDKKSFLANSAYRRLESYGFSVFVAVGDETLYISENTDASYFDQLNTSSPDYSSGLVFLDDDTMQIQDTTMTSDARTIRVTLKSTGRPSERRTSAALIIWQMSDTNFTVVALFLALFAALVDFLLVKTLTKSIIVPLEELGEAADRIKLGNLDDPVIIDDSAQEFSDLRQNFEEMRIQFKNSVEIKKKYEEIRRQTYSGLNHDIRTAVTAIKGYTQGLKDGIANTPEKRERYVDAISLSTESLEKLVDALSEMTRLEANTVAFHFEEKDMYALQAEWYAAALPSFEARGIKFIAVYGCDKRVFCNMDTFQFERVVDNLMSNCVKYKKPEKTHICVSIATSISDDGMYQIVYKDDGIGISDEDAPKIFDVFFRADEARSNVRSGNGIGLSIVKQIIIRHSGTITASGKKDEGLTLTIKLPITRTEEL